MSVRMRVLGYILYLLVVARIIATGRMDAISFQSPGRDDCAATIPSMAAALWTALGATRTMEGRVRSVLGVIERRQSTRPALIGLTRGGVPVLRHRLR
jgi:hypothetical protein